VIVPVLVLVGVAVGVVVNEPVGLAVGDALGVMVKVGELLGVTVGSTGAAEHPLAQVSTESNTSVQPAQSVVQVLALTASSQVPVPQLAPKHAQHEASARSTADGTMELTPRGSASASIHAMRLIAIAPRPAVFSITLPISPTRPLVRASANSRGLRHGFELVAYRRP
jgi:hypothetical protein